MDMGNLMLSLKVALISTAVVSVAVIFNLFVPLMSDFIVSDIPSLYTVILSYLRPPYLYLLINGIIISIVASSKFQQKSGTTYNPNPVPVPDRLPANSYNGTGESGISTSNVYNNVVVSGYGYGGDAAVAVERAVAPMTALPARISSVEAYTGAISSDLYNNLDRSGSSYDDATVAVDPTAFPTETTPARIPDGSFNDAGWREISSGNVYSNVIGRGYGYGDATVVVDRTAENERVLKDGDDNAVRPMKGPERMDTVELLSLLSEVEKPPVSRRFAQRKSVKVTHHPEGKALGVTKPKRHDTLESTWKTITEGRHVPLTRHLKKSDTWERVQKEQHASPPSLPNKMKKSDTFNDGKTTTSGTNNNESPLSRSSGSGKLKKEPSLSQDELNRRVEAFIKKFNKEMRLQRQESLNQYQEMIRRGAH